LKNIGFLIYIVLNKVTDFSRPQPSSKAACHEHLEQVALCVVVLLSEEGEEQRSGGDMTGGVKRGGKREKGRKGEGSFLRLFLLE